MTFRPRHLSVSSVALYTRCPAQFAQRYVHKMVTPTNVYQATGTAFHKALEAEHRGQDSERAWIAAYNAVETNGLTPVMSKEHGLNLLNLYRSAGLGGAVGEPERKFLLPFPSRRIPVPLLGFIDLHVPENREYRDWKTTGGSSWTQTKVDLEPQVHVYGWAYQQINRHRAERALWCVFNTSKLMLDVFKTAPSPDGFRLFEMQAEAAWVGITAGAFDGCGGCPELCAPPAERPVKSPTFTWKETAP